jgi:hypothetical protein
MFVGGVALLATCLASKFQFSPGRVHGGAR